jgi:hypothetical protein
MDHERENRRTCVITMTSVTAHDVIRVCDPECRDAFLIDLGLKGSGGGWAFRSHGVARVTVAWNHKDYDVTWKRCPPSALPCDSCGDEWKFRPVRTPVLPPPAPPTEAQLRARESFASRVRSKGRFPVAAGDETPRG